MKLKFKRIFLVSLILLTIITIGAVSAADDSGNLTVSDGAVDSAESSLETVDLSAGDEEALETGQVYDEEIQVDAPSEVKAYEESMITVTLPEEVEGYITKYVDDEGYDDYWVYDGVSNIYFSFYDLGLHTIDLKYSGDGDYDEKIIWTNTYDVKDFVLDISGDYVQFGQDGYVVVNTLGDAEGTLTLKINGETYTRDVQNGHFTISNLKFGENAFTVTYSGDEKYDSKSASGVITTYACIDIPDSIYYNQETVVSLTLPTNAKGNLIVNFNNKKYSSKLVKGKASIKIPSDLDLGEYDFEAYYDGSDYDIEEFEGQLELVPGILVPKTVWIEDMGDIIIDTPLLNSVLEIEINGEYYKTIDIDNAKTIIPLVDLDLDFYNNEIYLRYLHDHEFDYYSHDYYFEVDVRENSPNLDLDINVSDICLGENLYISRDLPDEVYENLLMYIDGALYQVEDNNFDDIDTSNLALGKHTIEFVLKNDEYYKDTSKTFSFEVVEVLIDIPDKIIIGHDSVEVETAKNLRGNITVFVDGNKYKMMPILPGYFEYDHVYSFYFGFDDLIMGKHNIEVVYSGDGNHKPIAKSADVNVSYEISFDMDYAEDAYYYGSENVMNVFLPIDATKDISIKIDGISFNNIIGEDVYYDRIISLNISNLNIGPHTIEISYPGDEKYGPLKISRNFNVTPLINRGNDIFVGESGYVSLKLPEDANGKLVVVVDDDERHTKSLKKGFANVSLDNLPAGEREIYAYYSGDDYEVESIQFLLSVKQYVWEPYYFDESGYFYLKMPADAKGNLIVKLDGNQYKKQKLRNGEANITIKPIFGDHFLEFLYDGDDYEFTYETDWSSAPVEFLNWVIFNGESFELMSIKDAKGKFSASVNGKTYDLKFVEGRANFTPTNLHFGENDVYIKYVGDDYGTYEEIIDVWLQPTVYVGHEDDYVKMTWDKLGGFELLNRNISSSDNMIINFGNDFDGEYALIIDQDLYANGQVVNGVVNISLSKLQLGFKRINIVYESVKNQYEYTFFFANIKKAPEISVTSNDVYDGQKVKITVNAAKDISDNVVVTVNNKNYTVKLSKGKGSLEVPNLAVGNYPISVKYLGDKNFAGDSVKSSVNVLSKLNPNMIVSAHDIMKGDLEIIKISADKSISGSVLVNINNNNYTVELTDGQGSLNVSGLNPDTYAVKATFKGNTKFISQSVKATFKVTHIPKITAKAVSVLYTAKGKYSVTVYGTDGKVAKGVNVVFKIAGKKVKTVKTNSRGVATFTVTKAPGTYKVSATALGKTVTKKLTVKHVVTLKKVTPKKSAKKLVLTATLKKVNGKYLKNKQITFKFNGKKYVGKTNKKGVAKVTIKKSVLKKLKVGKKVTYQATYLKDIVKQSVKVKK